MSHSVWLSCKRPRSFWDKDRKPSRPAEMGKVEGGMKCVKYLLFIFNFIFWVSARFVDGRCDVTRKLMEQVQQRARPISSHLTFTRTVFLFLISLLCLYLLCPFSECSVRLTVRDGRRFVVRLTGLKSDFPQRKRTPSFSPGKRVFERKTE